MVMNDSTIVESEISDSAVVYHRAFVKNSVLQTKATVADDCTITNSCLEENSYIGHRSMFISSYIGVGSYIGSDGVVKNTKIGNYSSLSWQISAGGGKHQIDCASSYSDDWWKRTFNVDLGRTTTTEKCFIGNDVWIGSGAIILGGI
ncbi:MAG: hypothetical protein XD75_0268 [Parcubacteria bacterium 33_209]|jgi:acetyltransferase-like isoleucine patch superfamily enzyme|nr:MAG: hypothetical protein XD75_0268 [Parcubacteria bacterium 33_209]